MPSLCESCGHVREVVSGTGSRFLLCQLSLQDKRFPKYPPQPVFHCAGFTSRGYQLELLPGTFAVSRLPSDAAIPDWASGEIVSTTRTTDELSIVCASDKIPDNVRQEPGWRCLKVAGPLDFTMVGVLASLTGPLADANISVLAISTFDTDYLLVKEHDLEAAIDVLKASGHEVIH